jgi:hypothetical protein
MGYSFPFLFDGTFPSAGGCCRNSEASVLICAVQCPNFRVALLGPRCPPGVITFGGSRDSLQPGATGPRRYLTLHDPSGPSDFWVRS